MRRPVEPPPLVEHFAIWLALGLGLAALVACAIAYLTIRPAKAAEAYRVPAACAALAQRIDLPDVLSREQALEAKAWLERNRARPGALQCLAAVEKAWRLR